MPKEEWGVKRLCIKCKSRFYDLNMDPMTCPECGASFSLDEFLGNKVKAPKEPAPINKEKEEDQEPIVDNIDEDELLLDDTSDSIPDELDETLLEEDEEDTVSLEEITDVSSPDDESVSLEELTDVPSENDDN